ncbi:MAG: cell division protein FtsA, partial [Faecalibacillus sp.]
MNEIYAVLDIGSATIELLVGEVVNSNLHVLFAKKVPSHGVKKGIVEDDRLLVRDIQALIQEANEFLEGEIKRVGITIPTIRAKLYQSNSSISLNNEIPVTNEDIVRGLQLSKRIKISSKEEVVCVVPVRYHSDSGMTLDAPVGQKTRNLIVDSLVITSRKNILYPYISSVEKAGLEVMDICVNAYACAKEAFDAVYLQEGALIIDIGYKTSTVSFYKDGYLQYLTVCPVGGYNLTRAIAQNLQI